MGPDRRIADYIAANRKRYTREAITQQLTDAGYSQESIAATWAALDAPDPDSRPDTGFWGRFWWMLIGVNLAVLLGVGLLTGLFANLEQGGFLLAILAVLLAIGALISWGIVAATSPDKMSRTGSTIIGITIPLIFALLIGGTCFALVGTIGPPPRSGTLELDAGELSGSGRATCYVGQPGGGFSVFAEVSGDPNMSVDVNTFPPQGGPPTDEVQNVSIFVQDERGTSYGNSRGNAELSSEVGDGGLNGTVTFSGLTSDVFAEGTAPEASEGISGTITWTCD
jgi:hypothetical protein